MSFILSAIIAVLITVPGMYLISRTKLASSITEVVSNGFFFGFGLVVLIYLALCRFVPAYCVDAVIVFVSVAALPLMIRQLRAQGLPLWISPPSRAQTFLVVMSLVFMIVLAFGELTRCVDDDIWTHLSVIKRVSMGDVPPHMPFCPQVFMRGHVGRDVFVGTVARFLDLRPELATIYVTLVVCPFYIFAVHAFAWRLARGKPISTCFCFIGLAYLVSCAVGDVGLRAGVITYLLNHLAFAYSHAVFFGWLLERVLSTVTLERGVVSTIVNNRLTLAVCMIAFASMYFVYMSNFLMFALFLAILPVLGFIAYPNQRGQRLTYMLVLLGTVTVGALFILVLVSPFFLERVLITLRICQTQEPLGFLQQAQFTFPKTPLFTITDPSGNDVPFLSFNSLSAQGLSFYIGLSGLVVGFLVRDFRLVATSSLGWLTMAWVLLVDMGDYRADVLRLMLLAHMSFGATTGLIIGEGIERIFALRSNQDRKPGFLFKTSVVLLSTLLCVWMGWGNIAKFVTNKSYRIARSFQRLRAIQLRDPDSWLDSMAIRALDFEVLQALSSYVRSPKATVLLRLNQKSGYSPLYLNTGAVTGAGVVGTCLNHALKVDMGRILMDYDYRASLFWLRPSSELLTQLAPDWIVIDPSSVPDEILKSVLSLPGIKVARQFEDGEGNKRMLISYKKARKYTAPSTQVKSLTPDESVVRMSRLGLAAVSATVRADSVSSNPLNIAMLVTDERDRVANAMDLPILSTEFDGPNHIKIYFSMIQSGRWRVYFVDPATNRRLNERPVEVEVST